MTRMGQYGSIAVRGRRIASNCKQAGIAEIGHIRPGLVFSCAVFDPGRVSQIPYVPCAVESVPLAKKWQTWQTWQTIEIL